MSTAEANSGCVSRQRRQPYQLSRIVGQYHSTPHDGLSARLRIPGNGFQVQKPARSSGCWVMPSGNLYISYSLYATTPQNMHATTIAMHTTRIRIRRVETWNAAKIGKAN